MSKRISGISYVGNNKVAASLKDSVDGGPSQTSQRQRAQRDYLPSLNRMLVDLKKLDYFSDPKSVLFNLRNTLEET